MKRLIIATIVGMMATISFGQKIALDTELKVKKPKLNGLEIRIGGGSGELDIKTTGDDSFTEDISKTSSIGLEYFSNTACDKLKLGYGFLIQDHGEYDYDGVDVEFSSVSVFGSGKFYFNITNDLKPYIKANLGVSLNRDDGKLAYYADYTGYYHSVEIENGLYSAIGIGFDIKNKFIVEFMFENNSADVKYFINNVKLNYESEVMVKRSSIVLGYRF